MKPFIKYFKKIIDGLVKIGYTRNMNIKAAPYDFRLTPRSNEEYVKNTVELIE